MNKSITKVEIAFGGTSYILIFNWYSLKNSKEKFKRIFSIISLIAGIISFMSFIVGFIY